MHAVEGSVVEVGVTPAALRLDGTVTVVRPAARGAHLVRVRVGLGLGLADPNPNPNPCTPWKEALSKWALHPLL